MRPGTCVYIYMDVRGCSRVEYMCVASVSRVGIGSLYVSVRYSVHMACEACESSDDEREMYSCTSDFCITPLPRARTHTH